MTCGALGRGMELDPIGLWIAMWGRRSAFMVDVETYDTQHIRHGGVHVGG